MADTPESDSSTAQHHHFQHSRKRLRQLLRPNGRRVHVASTPDEVEGLRRALTCTEDTDAFDIVIHGSPEHLEALHEVHTHHELQRQQMRQKYGSQFDELERIIHQVDQIGHELSTISEKAGVQLSANFDKYGYSARLRTKESPNTSSANSLSEESDSQHQEDFYRASRKKGEVMKFWTRPIVRQYFHRGLLWRAEEEQSVGSFELFIDLFYVAILEVSGGTAAEEPTGHALLSFAITFIMAWKFWSDIALFISWFDADDILRRLKVMLLLACLLGFTSNVSMALKDTYTPLVAFYLAARLLHALHFMVLAFLIPMVRASMVWNSICILIPVGLWIGSIHVEEPNRLALIWIAILFDLCGTFLVIFFQRNGLSFLPGKLGQWFKESFEFQPATNIEHRIERTNAFVCLVFGYSVIGLLYQSQKDFGLNAFFGKSVLALIQAFSFNWIYFEIDNFNLHTHAIRRHVVSSVTWMAIHLPFIMGYTLAAATLSRIVLAHDCGNADPHWLAHESEELSHEELEEGLRWFYCAGLGVALASMGIVSLSHIHKKIPGERVTKHWRLLLRFAVSIVLILLPLAGDRLNSLELVGTTTALVVLVLVFDLFGSTCTGEPFWMCGGKCSYTAKTKLSRKDLENNLKSGQKLQVEELVENEKTEHSEVHF